MPKRLWTNEECKLLEECYKKEMSVDEMEKIFKRSKSSILSKANKLGISKRYPKKYSVYFDAPYKDYDWCFEQIINQSKHPQQIANETGFSLRVIEKWAYEKFGLSNRTYRCLATLSPIQQKIITAGTLGDGHIDKREKYPIYIECHSDLQKDYLFWKYNHLKNICLSEPKWYPASEKIIKGKKCFCRPTYRMETRTINQLADIRKMPQIQKINELDELGICLHILDDGSRSKCQWDICLAEWTEEEINAYVEKLDNLNLVTKRLKKMYLSLDSASSKILDELILSFFPSEMDIIRDKIMRWQT